MELIYLADKNDYFFMLRDSGLTILKCLQECIVQRNPIFRIIPLVQARFAHLKVILTSPEL